MFTFRRSKLFSGYSDDRIRSWLVRTRWRLFRSLAHFRSSWRTRETRFFRFVKTLRYATKYLSPLGVILFWTFLPTGPEIRFAGVHTHTSNRLTEIWFGNIPETPLSKLNNGEKIRPGGPIYTRSICGAIYPGDILAHPLARDFFYVFRNELT